MISINHNEAITQLKTIVEQELQKKLDYMPKKFNEEQLYALKLLKQRIYLEEVVEESVSFNRKLNWQETNPNLKLVNSVENLIDVFKLRSEVYLGIGYQDEFPDAIEGLNFDEYDKNAAIIFYSSNNIVSGTARVIFDVKKKLPSELKFSFEQLRQEYKNISELSRLTIKHGSKGLNLEFKNLTKGVYEIYNQNSIDIILSGIRKDHYELYSKFGGFNIEQELDAYGKLDVPFLITSWDASQASTFFKRLFLK